MSRESILILLAVLIIISPWSGLSLSILEWILPLLGIAVVFIGVTLRARRNHDVALKAREASSRPVQELY